MTGRKLGIQFKRKLKFPKPYKLPSIPANSKPKHRQPLKITMAQNDPTQFAVNAHNNGPEAALPLPDNPPPPPAPQPPNPANPAEPAYANQQAPPPPAPQPPNPAPPAEPANDNQQAPPPPAQQPQNDDNQQLRQLIQEATQGPLDNIGRQTDTLTEEFRQTRTRLDDLQNNYTNTVADSLKLSAMIQALSPRNKLTFSGEPTQKCADWIQQSEEILQFLRREPEVARQIVLQTTTGSLYQFLAHEWRDHNPDTWPRLKEEIQKRFGDPTLQGKALVQLEYMTQGDKSLNQFAEELVKTAREAYPENPQLDDQLHQDRLARSFATGINDQAIREKTWAKYHTGTRNLQGVLNEALRLESKKDHAAAANVKFQFLKQEAEPREVEATTAPFKRLQEMAARINEATPTNTQGTPQPAMPAVQANYQQEVTHQPEVTQPNMPLYAEAHPTQSVNNGQPGYNPPNGNNFQGPPAQLNPYLQGGPQLTPPQVIVITDPMGGRHSVPRDKLMKVNGVTLCYWCQGNHLFKHCHILAQQNGLHLN